MATHHPLGDSGEGGIPSRVKVCAVCGVEKPVAEFKRSRLSADGRRPDCNNCRATHGGTFPETQRTCTRCGVERPIDRFSRAPLHINGRKRICKNCLAAYQIDRRRTLVHRANERPRRTPVVATGPHGGAVEEFANMAAAQGNRCALCGWEPDPAAKLRPRRQLMVDHDQQTGIVRGPLCRRCGVALAGFSSTYDPPGMFERGVSFLRAHGASTGREGVA